MLLASDDGVAEARLLHPSEYGFFALMRPTSRGGLSQTMYGLDRLEDVVRGMRSTPDAYISQASFVSKSRRASALGQMRAAFVDLDCYKCGETPSDSFVADVLAMAREIGMPEPSYVVGSGRGLYAKWIFDTPIGAGKLMQWKALQSSLNLLYRTIGADVRAKDASRVLRVLGTTNSKTQDGAGVVRIRHDSGLTHCFEELCGVVAAAKFAGYLGGYGEGAWRVEGEDDDEGGDGELDATAAARAVLRRLARATSTPAASTTDLSMLTTFEQIHRPILLKQNTVQSLNWHRFLDLRTLAMQRRGIHEGTRDHFLFWMMTFLGHAEVVTPKNFWGEAKDLSSIISTRGFMPLKDGSLGTVYRKLCDRHAGRKIDFKGGRYDPLYTASNAHLIDVLEITSDEQQGLLTLIDGREKARRVDAKNPERVERREQRLQWRAQASSMISSGASLRQVAEATGASLSRVKHLSSAIAAAAPTQAGCSAAGQEAPRAASTRTWHAQARALKEKGACASAIARQLGVHRSSVTRMLKATGNAADTMSPGAEHAHRGCVDAHTGEILPATQTTQQDPAPATAVALPSAPTPTPTHTPAPAWSSEAQAEEGLARETLVVRLEQQREAARLGRERDALRMQAEREQRVLQLMNQVERLRVRARADRAGGLPATPDSRDAPARDGALPRVELLFTQSAGAASSAQRAAQTATPPTTLRKDGEHAQQTGGPPEQGTYRQGRTSRPIHAGGVPERGAAFRDLIERLRAGPKRPERVRGACAT